MARYSHHSPAFDFFQPTPTLDSKPIFSKDEEMSVLDDKILDSNSQDIYPGSARRSSFDHNPDVFSRRESVWSDMAHHRSDSQSRISSQLSTPLFEPVHNPFIRLDTHTSSFAQQHQQSWPLSAGSGSCTPTPIYEHFPQESDATGNSYSGGLSHVATLPYSQTSFKASPPFMGPTSTPMSPQDSQGWATGNSEISDVQSKAAKTAAIFRSATSSLTIRRDGIRKKNARFDIPAERTLSNIDMLITQTTDEDEIKELKQQKRLLRNRQAALDSRQRKKIHTEQLEEDKRRASSVINELQEALQEMKLRESEFIREKAEFLDREQQMHQYMERLHMEKEEMIRTHTLETGELRKKNNILREHMESMELNAHQAAAPPALRTGYPDFGNLTVDNHSWDRFPMSDDLSLDNEHRPMPSTPGPNTFNLGLKKPEKLMEKQSDSSFSWNAFYMCLLFGAFIASNTTPTSQPAIPALSEEYRTESANVLKAVLASAPPSDSTGSLIPLPSSTLTTLPTTISGSEMAQMTSGLSGSTTNLDSLHRNLIAPTKEQEDAQAFALTTEQYRSLTTLEEDEDMGDHMPPPSNLQQAYNAMRNNGLQNRMGMKPSDVYTRSVLWDCVPEKVLHDFRNMVKECSVNNVKPEEPGGEMCTS
ncbi:hypothetical protein FQN57_005984 [Myotisia sp. PD_48]|nr:hypothetical protein FQN57_005984 [Myotisia sp. PD_48]